MSSFHLKYFIVLTVLTYCIAIKHGQGENYVYGNVMKYLKMYSDIDIDNVLFVEGATESMDVEEWFDYVTLADEHLLFEFFFPFTYLTGTIENSIRKFVDALSQSQKSSLIVVNNFEDSERSQNILKYLSENLLRNHIWLFLYPYANITVDNFRSLLLGKEANAHSKLRLNSQVSYLF